MPFIDRADGSDARIWWEEEGAPDGDAVLLVQGLGYPGAMWYRVTPYLTEYRTLWFDNRGVGRTGVPTGPYPVEVMADDAAAVLDAAGVDAAHVIGASMGGFIAQELALRHPDRVRSLVLGCTATGGPEMAPAEPAALEMVAARAQMTPAEAAEAAVPFVYAADTPRARIEEDFAVRARIPTTPEGYTNQVLGVMSWAGAHDRVGSLSMPVLVITGTADRLVNPDNSKLLADAIPGAELVLLDGASHVFFTDQPEAAGDAIVSFLRRVGTG